MRYKPENMFLAGVVPGPHEPPLTALNHYLTPLKAVSYSVLLLPSYAIFLAHARRPDLQHHLTNIFALFVIVRALNMATGIPT
ncbi:hypothetical protein HYPSUDRAFT_208847 [Hypholoma sublateritium FD-334 SS-4]|uniref:Uncharacterized protein n=1 Tax=Hypholoma sublateritium (strain FD-334 SS-4) TaxID=945553 RepID=A0A0D2N518_HYPSF|nr:hypothetical protein HYPSUDRAFT_208847 [Hypholoma sublateritium FD-334 SS-4]